jgi:hypothetical protein
MAVRAAMLQRLTRITRCQLQAVYSNSYGFRMIHDQALTAFRQILTDKGVITHPVALQGRNFDWFENRAAGNATVMLAPACTAEVSQVLAYCNKNGIPVVPQGGNTGVVGGGIASQNEVLLSFSRMNRVLEFSAVRFMHICAVLAAHLSSTQT